MTIRLLEDHQVEIAEQISEVLAPYHLHDALMAMVSVIAGTCNYALDNGAGSRALAEELCHRIMITVDAGQAGAFQMASPKGRVLS